MNHSGHRQLKRPPHSTRPRSISASPRAARAARTTVAIRTTTSHARTSSVSGSPAGVITDVNVGLNLTHTFDPDLVITLISPTGTRILLSANNGSSFPRRAELHQHHLRRPGPTPIAEGLPPFAGSFSPSAAERSDRRSAQRDSGRWRSTTSCGIDTGILLDWSLTIQVGPSRRSSRHGRPDGPERQRRPGRGRPRQLRGTPIESGDPFPAPFDATPCR